MLERYPTALKSNGLVKFTETHEGLQSSKCRKTITQNTRKNLRSSVSGCYRQSGAKVQDNARLG